MNMNDIRELAAEIRVAVTELTQTNSQGAIEKVSNAVLTLELYLKGDFEGLWRATRASLKEVQTQLSTRASPPLRPALKKSISFASITEEAVGAAVTAVTAVTAVKDGSEYFTDRETSPHTVPRLQPLPQGAFTPPVLKVMPPMHSLPPLHQLPEGRAM